MMKFHIIITLALLLPFTAHANIFNLPAAWFESEIRTAILAVIEEAGYKIPDYDEVVRKIQEKEFDGILDPEVFKTPQEMIESHGLVFETHKIHTEDRYILTAWRVYDRNNNNHKPVIL